MRVAVILLVVGGLAACASVGGASSYELGSGDANYDAINAATRTCEAEGGHVTLKGGYDNRKLSSFLCVGGKAK